MDLGTENEEDERKWSGKRDDRGVEFCKVIAAATVVTAAWLSTVEATLKPNKWNAERRDVL